MKKLLFFVVVSCCALSVYAGLNSFGNVPMHHADCANITSELSASFASTGGASYKESTKTLTLNNFVHDSLKEIFYIKHYDTLNIYLLGENRIENCRIDHMSGGSYKDDAPTYIRIYGPGSLYINYKKGRVIYDEYLTLELDGANFIAEVAESYAIYVDTMIVRNSYLATPKGGFLGHLLGKNCIVRSADYNAVPYIKFLKDDSEKIDYEIVGVQLTKNQPYHLWYHEAQYVDSLKALVMNNAVINSDNNNGAIVSYSKGDGMNIILRGDNEINCVNGSNAIRSDNQDVTISRYGTLNIHTSGNAAAIYTDEYSLTIKDRAMVNVFADDSNAMGISLSRGRLIVDDASLTCQGYPSISNIDALTLRNGATMTTEKMRFSGEEHAVVDSTGEATNEPVVIDLLRVQKLQTITDIEGNVYPIITIGEQTWMAENLRATVYDTKSERYGDTILAHKYGRMVYMPQYMDAGDTSKWSTSKYASNIPADDWARLGYCYNWSAALGLDTIDARDTISFTGYRQGICPNGWHIPSLQEWQILLEEVGDSAALTLKSANGWFEHPGLSSDGFNVYPSGSYQYIGIAGLGRQAHFATSTQYVVPKKEYNDLRYYGWSMQFNYSNQRVSHISMPKYEGVCIRCLKDAEPSTADVAPKATPDVQGQKRIVNGHLYIEANGNTYNAQGSIIK